jgi:AraC family transcriptional regulator of adaptative response/methylated-DNA-[protein]-cysteine methyltransferase
MRRAVLARDGRYEGVFVFGVRTTGVYCRPGCPARAPRPENLSFHADSAQAEAAGLRPCRRCRPERAAGEAPGWMRRLEAERSATGATRWTDADLVARGLEPRTVRRAFLARHGVTFHAWQRALELGRARERLRAGADVLGVSLDSGYASGSGFRAAFASLFGASPRRADATSACAGRVLASPLGALLAMASERGVCLLEFADRASLAAQARSLVRWRGAVVVPGTNAHLDQLASELEQYFAGRRREFQVALDLAGPPFHLRVWEALRRIPHGRTLSYADLAGRLGRPGAQRAVASANRANRVAVVVPCHRVVGADGRLTGYGGGLWRKRRLLELEGLDLPGDRLARDNELFFPKG